MLAAICLMVVFLITAIEAVAYWTPGYYEMEYEKYQVLNDLPEMTMEDLLTVTDEMMKFLRGNRADLHVYTTMGGQYREFFNEREIAHMIDVQKLFLNGLALRRICVIMAAVLIAPFFFSKSKKDALRILSGSLCIGTLVFFAAALFIAGIISTNFSKYFIVFHHIFFTNDLWILNPSTDMLINIVPEPFFMDTALRIGLVFAAMVLVFFCVCLAFFLWTKKRNSNFLQ